MCVCVCMIGGGGGGGGWRVGVYDEDEYCLSFQYNVVLTSSGFPCSIL